MFKSIYTVVENEAVEDFAGFLDNIKQLGRGANFQPQYTEIYRIRQDGQAAIFRALFTDSNLDPLACVSWLEGALSVSPLTLAGDTEEYLHGANSYLVTVSGGKVALVKIIILGGLSVDPVASLIECIGYIQQSEAVWNEPPPEEEQ